MQSDVNLLRSVADTPEIVKISGDVLEKLAKEFGLRSIKRPILALVRNESTYRGLLGLRIIGVQRTANPVAAAAFIGYYWFQDSDFPSTWKGNVARTLAGALLVANIYGGPIAAFLLSNFHTDAATKKGNSSSDNRSAVEVGRLQTVQLLETLGSEALRRYALWTEPKPVTNFQEITNFLENELPDVLDILVAELERERSTN